MDDRGLEELVGQPVGYRAIGAGYATFRRVVETPLHLALEARP